MRKKLYPVKLTRPLQKSKQINMNFSQGFQPQVPRMRRPRTPPPKPTRFYDGFDGFTFQGAPPARNPHIDEGRSR